MTWVCEVGRASWTSYPSIFNIGHRAIKDLLIGEVNIEEKVDGSQFSFGMVPSNLDDKGQPVDVVYSETEDGIPFSLKIRSKGAVMHIDAPEKMFNQAAETVKALADKIHVGWTYRAEYLAKPKHNSLVYDRVPKQNLILFDVNTEDGGFLTYEEKVKEGQRLGLEVVPRIFKGFLINMDQFRTFLDNLSILGGQKIEGVVVKPVNYDLYGQDKKVLMGKFVSEAFKEVHRKAWGESNPTQKDVVTRVGESLTTPARWNKAIQHMKERGILDGSPRDIGPLMKEVVDDIWKEEQDFMKDELFKQAWPHIRRLVTRGLPEWYKEQLLKQAFEQEEVQPPEQGVTDKE